MQKYYEALKADQAFTDIIKEVYGSKATRWTIPQNNWELDPRVLAVKITKINKDKGVLS